MARKRLAITRIEEDVATPIFGRKPEVGTRLMAYVMDKKYGELPVGWLVLERRGLTINKKDYGNAMVIGQITVKDWALRSGVGTALYERAAQIAYERFGLPLRSDLDRSPEAQNFWEKQIRKRRARCLFKTTAPVPPGPRDEALPYRGGCVAYQLTYPPPKTLAAARLPRRHSKK